MNPLCDTIGYNSFPTTTCVGDLMAAGSTTTSIGGYNNWSPWYPLYIHPPYVAPATCEIGIRKVENGWILVKGGKEYLIKDAKEILEHVKKD